MVEKQKASPIPQPPLTNNYIIPIPPKHYPTHRIAKSFNILQEEIMKEYNELTFGVIGNIQVVLHINLSVNPHLATISINKNNYTWSITIRNQTWPSLDKLLITSLTIISAILLTKSKVELITNNMRTEQIYNKVTTKPTNKAKEIIYQDLAPYQLNLNAINENKKLQYDIVYKNDVNTKYNKEINYVEFSLSYLVNLFHIYLHQQAAPFTARHLLKKLHKAENINDWLSQNRIQKWNTEDNKINWNLIYKNIDHHSKPLTRQTHPSHSKIKSFKIKILTNELSTLCNLHSRYPETHKNQTCKACKT